VTFDSETLLQCLADLAAKAGPPQRYVLAFSGGLDSTVLLHALASTASRRAVPLVVVHVNHGLHADAEQWAQHCCDTAAAAQLACHVERVRVDKSSGDGLEAAARKARYDALRARMRAGDWLLTAHHQDDQAETVLLNLMRGSGPAGIAGIGRIRPFAAGWLARPLLGWPRAALLDYAQRHKLRWLDDPSNADQGLDRNFLRQKIMPRLEARWSGAAQRLQRSSELAGEAALLLDDLAALDAAQVCAADRPRSTQSRYDRLHVDALCKLPDARQRNLLRYVIRQLALPVPGAAQLQQIQDSLLTARSDAMPVVAWQGAEIRRYRGQLYILPPALAAPAPPQGAVMQSDYLPLAPGLGALRLATGAAEGLSEALVSTGLELRYRQGGEEFQPQGQAHTRKLKKLLQENGIVPWMRDRIPLLYADGRLVAVADLWLAAGATSQPGTAVLWQNRPSIY